MINPIFKDIYVKQSDALIESYNRILYLYKTYPFEGIEGNTAAEHLKLAAEELKSSLKKALTALEVNFS